MRNDGWSVAAIFCMDVAFVSEPTKYIAGAMQVSRDSHAGWLGLKSY